MPNSNFMSDANATAIFTAYATAIKLGLKAWIGTTAEWDQLTDAQKKQYQVNFKTDDCSEESIDVVKRSIADDFSINVNYNKGEYCYHLGDLYKFTSAHTAGAWSSADVEQVQVCDELSELKNTLTETAYGQLSTNKVKLVLTKKSGIAFLDIENLSSITAGNNLIKDIIPAGYRPRGSFKTCLVERNSSFQRIVELTVTSSGDVEIYNYGSAITETKPFSGALSYPIA